MISPDDKRLAESLGLTRRAGESEEEFLCRVYNLKGHATLLREAKEIGVNLTQGMTSAEVRRALCEQQLTLLKARGFIEEALFAVKPDQTLRLTKIVHNTHRTSPKVTVHYWIEKPWNNSTNQGRANHKPAKGNSKPSVATELNTVQKPFHYHRGRALNARSHY